VDTIVLKQLGRNENAYEVWSRKPLGKQHYRETGKEVGFQNEGPKTEKQIVGTGGVNDQ
jgi:hypothetical protein